MGVHEYVGKMNAVLCALELLLDILLQYLFPLLQMMQCSSPMLYNEPPWTVTF